MLGEVDPGMIHDLLSLLAGCDSSSLFEQSPSGVTYTLAKSTNGVLQLTKAETAVLDELGHIAQLYRSVRDQTENLLSAPLMATTSSISYHVYLGVMQELDVYLAEVADTEAGIISRRDDLVGSSVPLSRVMAIFYKWEATLRYLRELVFDETDFLRRLCADRQTRWDGNKDLVDRLLTLAEGAWKEQLCYWLRLGDVKPDGADDFFIHVNEHGTRIRVEHFPPFLSEHAASSLMLVGMTLKQLILQNKAHFFIHESLDNFTWSTTHLDYLILDEFSKTVRTAFGQQCLRPLLPLSSIRTTIKYFRDYFLLGEGIFAQQLIAAGRLVMPVKNLFATAFEDAVSNEDTQFINRTHFSLTERHAVFDDWLTKMPLRLKFDRSWTDGLYFGSREMHMYEKWFFYLLAIHIAISELDSVVLVRSGAYSLSRKTYGLFHVTNYTLRTLLSHFQVTVYTCLYYKLIM